MKILRFTLRAALWGLALLVLIGALGVGYVWLKSPGGAQPILAANGAVEPASVSLLLEMQIGGVEQSVILRGRSANAPVLLVLHGGPGNPASPFFRARNQGLEDDFLVAYWEQRGAGLSFDPDADPAALTIEQLVADTAEVAAQLSAEFDQEKVFLLGHSWGGALAILAARDHPQLFHKVYAVSPAIQQYEAERLALAWLKEQAAGDSAMSDALSELQLPAKDASGDDWMIYLGAQRGWLDASGSGTAHDPISLLQLFGMLVHTPEYTLGDKWRYLRGGRASMQRLWPQVIALNLADNAANLDVPIVLIHGAHDRVTPLALTKAYFDALNAPEKEFFVFANSAHSALLEEPEAFNTLLRAALH